MWCMSVAKCLGFVQNKTIQKYGNRKKYGCLLVQKWHITNFEEKLGREKERKRKTTTQSNLLCDLILSHRCRKSKRYFMSCD